MQGSQECLIVCGQETQQVNTPVEPPETKHVTAYQRKSHTQRLFAMASDKLVRLGITTKKITIRERVLDHIARHCGYAHFGDIDGYLEEFVGSSQEEVLSDKIAQAAHVNVVTPPPAPPNLNERKPYKMSAALRIAAKRASAEQPDLISVNSVLKYINLGNDR